MREMHTTSPVDVKKYIEDFSYPHALQNNAFYFYDGDCTNVVIVSREEGEIIRILYTEHQGMIKSKSIDKIREFFNKSDVDNEVYLFDFIRDEFIFNVLEFKTMGRIFLSIPPMDDRKKYLAIYTTYDKNQVVKRGLCMISGENEKPEMKTLFTMSCFSMKLIMPPKAFNLFGVRIFKQILVSNKECKDLSSVYCHLDLTKYLVPKLATDDIHSSSMEGINIISNKFLESMEKKETKENGESAKQNKAISVSLKYLISQSKMPDWVDENANITIDTKLNDFEVKKAYVEKTAERYFLFIGIKSPKKVNEMFLTSLEDSVPAPFAVFYEEY